MEKRGVGGHVDNPIQMRKLSRHDKRPTESAHTLSKARTLSEAHSLSEAHTLSKAHSLSEAHSQAVEVGTEASQAVEEGMEQSQALEVGTERDEDSNDTLPRQVDEGLARLTTSEAYYALNAQVSEILEDPEPLTFQEALNSPKRKEWIKGM